MTDIFKNLSATKKGRFVLITVEAVVVIAMALLYIWFFNEKGRGVPCVFNLVTQFECPGCGVTRMMVALCQGDLSTAFSCNALLLIMSPFFVLYGVKYIVTYIIHGKYESSKVEMIILVALIIVFLAFGVLRNIY